MNTKQQRTVLISFASMILSVAVACIGFGQSGLSPRFEVASVKPNPVGGPGNGGVRTFPGGRLTTQAAVVRSIIQFAYRLAPFQLLGGPEWINSTRYDIDAKADGNASSEQLSLMLLSLLEDKFKLKAHRETRQLSVYDLTPGKNGVKLLPPPKEGGCIVIDPNQPRQGMPPTTPGQAPPPPCGSVFMNAGPSGARLDGGNVSTAELCRVLSNMMGRTVIDKTGFTGTFDVHMAFTPDASLEGLPPRTGLGGERIQLAEDPSNGTIFSAIQQQLGLKLESAKGPVEVVVIDSVDKPSDQIRKR